MTTLRRHALGALMLAARHSLRWPQTDLAGSVGCTTSHVSAMERGKRPTPAMLGRICDALRVPATERDHWYAAAGVLPQALVDALLARPERWAAVREVLR